MLYYFWRWQMQKDKFLLEWSMSLLNKYSHTVIESELKDYDLTKTQALFLIHIKQRKGIPQIKLAKMFKTNRSTVTRAVNHLVQQGYIEIRHDEDNLKSNYLFLTKLGDHIYIEIEKSISKWVNILTHDFTKNELALLKTSLLKMSLNASSYMNDHHLTHLIQRNMEE